MEKRILKESARYKFMPFHFGYKNDAGMTFESYLFTFADKYSPEYDSGYWEMCKIGDAPIMYPTGRNDYKVVNPDNFFDDTMSNEAFGICMTFMSLWVLVHKTQCSKLFEVYEKIENLKFSHPESRKIISFLD